MYLSDCQSHGDEYGFYAPNITAKANFSISSCLFEGNGSGVFVDHPDLADTLKLNDLTIVGCDTGIVVKTGYVRLKTSIVANCDIGAASTTGGLLLSHNLFFNLTQDVVNAQLVGPMLYLNPLFAGLSWGDYRLNNGSPASHPWGVSDPLGAFPVISSYQVRWQREEWSRTHPGSGSR